MKTKAFSALLILSMLVLSVGMVSACTGTNCRDEDTEVRGVIYTDVNGNGVYDAGTDTAISGANVNVVCHHGKHDNSKTAVSNSNGEYSALYEYPSKCDYGDKVVVTASKEGAVGENTGKINTIEYIHHPCTKLNVGVVNVPLVPEFGLVAGAVTLVSAVGIFFFVRRK